MSDSSKWFIEPCPFCGKTPKVIPEFPDRDGNAWAEVSCRDDKCPASIVCVEFYDDDDALQSSSACKLAAVQKWNRALSSNEKKIPVVTATQVENTNRAYTYTDDLRWIEEARAEIAVVPSYRSTWTRKGGSLYKVRNPNTSMESLELVYEGTDKDTHEFLDYWAKLWAIRMENIAEMASLDDEFEQAHSGVREEIQKAKFLRFFHLSRAEENKRKWKSYARAFNNAFTTDFS